MIERSTLDLSFITTTVTITTHLCVCVYVCMYTGTLFCLGLSYTTDLLVLVYWAAIDVQEIAHVLLSCGEIPL